MKAPQQYVDRRILKHQAEFIASELPHTGLVGGFGSGKSIAGTLKTIEKKLQFPGIDVAYYLPTSGLVKQIAFKNFKEHLAKQNIPFKLHETDKNFITPYGNIICRSMADPETIVGYEVGYSLIDEADILTAKKMNTAFTKIVGRNRKRLPDGAVNSIDLVSTPEGFKFLYEFFVKKANDKRKKLIRANSFSNPYLPEDYFENLLENYTPEMLQAYLRGEFVNLNSGTVYNRFDRKRNHTPAEINPREPLHVGIDFNVGNMAAVVHVVRKGKLYAVGEKVGLYDTSELAASLKETYKGHAIAAYPDASGKNRKSNSAETDIDILRKAGFTIRTGTKNPFVRDRINTMNLSFLSNKDEVLYYVNTDLCPRYTEALEQLSYKNGEPDKASGLDHVTDAGGYFCFYNRSGKGTASIRVNK